MLVATPGQTTAYSTLHNSGNTTTPTTTGPLAKKSTLTSSSSTTNATSATGTPKSLINNNNNSSTSNTNNHHNQNHRNDNKNNNATTTSTTISSKDLSSSATIHSLKTENSTKPSTNFIQTLKDSVQKALISTTGNNSIKLQNCINSTTTTTATSLQNVTSSSSSNAKAAATQSSSTSTNSATVATTSSLSLVRNKYSTCSLSKLHTIAPTIIHRYPEDRQHASSTDSLHKEMCHFKPIRTVPTTPWKSGSKSRGNSLRFPKPNLATKKTEFILKSNCDVNSRKKKQQPIQEDLDDEDDDTEDEQENKEYYGIYKPKPSSTFLFTTETTSNHPSAFVCLVAQMKNLVNIQSKNIIISGKGGRGSVMESVNLELTKTKNTRTARPAKDDHATAVLANNLISNTPNKKTKSTTREPVKKMYVRQKQKTTNKSILQISKVDDIPKDLVKVTTRSTRLSMATDKKKQNTNNTITPDIEDKNISKLSPAAGITKAKSRRKLDSAKTKINNIAQLASTVAKDELYTTANVRGQPVANSHHQVNKRKRKIIPEDVNEIISAASATPPTTTSLKSQGKSRKSARISKDICDNSNKLLKYSTDININQITNFSSNNKRHVKEQKSAVCFSPPLTRSRLKHLNQQQGKLDVEVKIKKRKI